MLKKITLIGLLVVLFGVLLWGGVNRTLARTESEGESQGRGRQEAGSEDGDLLFSGSAYADQGQENEGNGWGRGRQEDRLEDGSLSPGAGAYGEESQENGGHGRGRGEETDSHEFVPSETGELDEADKEALIFMREEEKLARDVYLAMYDLWGIPIFQNISSSEQSHTEAVKTLLDGYNVPDPAQDEVGVFTNPELQGLYDELIVQGSQSLAEALRVGAAIEEIDILDLEERLAQTDNADIQHVFNNLLQGSFNHLRAFTSTLMTQTGETYQPQFMSMDAYQAIIGESGMVGGQGRGARGGRGGRP